MPYDTEARRAVDLQTYADAPATIERLKAELLED